MKKFKIIPLSKTYAAGIRASLTDAFGHTVITQTATGKGPCRVSLKPFAVGSDRRMLLSHSPFEADNAFNQPGPIFINAEEVEPYQDVHRFPPAIKADKKSFPLTLIGYSKEQNMVYSRLVGDDDADLLIQQIFEEQPAVDYLHARNAQAGCFICRINRFEES